MELRTNNSALSEEKGRLEREVRTQVKNIEEKEERLRSNDDEIRELKGSISENLEEKIEIEQSLKKAKQHIEEQKLLHEQRLQKLKIQHQQQLQQALQSSPQPTQDESVVQSSSSNNSSPDPSPVFSNGQNENSNEEGQS